MLRSIVRTAASCCEQAGSEGLEALSVAHRDAPNNPGIAIDLANALIRMGDSGTALQVMRRSSASGRSSAPYIKLWLNLETVIGEPMVALKERGRIWNLNPLNWENGSQYASLLIDAPVRWTEIRDERTGEPVFREAEWERLPPRGCKHHIRIHLTICETAHMSLFDPPFGKKTISKPQTTWKLGSD